MDKAARRRFAAFLLLSALMIAVFLANILIGSTPIPPAEALYAFFGGAVEGVTDILWKIRVPRALAALLLGGALSLSGYLLQTFFHNPIAGPFVLGVSSGAKLTVAATVIIASGFVRSVGSGLMVAAAFAGSMLSLGFVLLVSRKMKQMSMLVVCGIMIGYICSAITDFIVTFADDSDIVNLHDWSNGTFSGTDMDSVAVIALLTAVGLVGTLLLSKPIGAYRLGENYAKNVGVNIGLLKAALVLLSGLFSACVTAFAGPVSFVGIAVPHIARMIFKTSKPLVMIPACFLSGSIFCMLCDMLARTVLSPTELSISTVTAVFGAPIVIVIMIRRKRGEAL
ncbi:MAG: iron ABC transporter permease [Bacteroides sp.]|nr:iron ABC transporter permease [Eubacterium sp.]MCM1417848.1 iron ABC transporter permease [Roseburia sp.]MCM1461287.1 iron ABC transporter permease [Bacteroides sp.]